MTRPKVVPPNDVSQQHSVATFVFVVDDRVHEATIAGPRIPGHDGAALEEAAQILDEHFSRVAEAAPHGLRMGTLPRVRVEGRILVSGSCHWIARPDGAPNQNLNALLPVYAERIARFVRTPSRLRVVSATSKSAPLVSRLIRRTTAP